LKAIPLSELKLSNKVYNCLKKANVVTIFDLLEYRVSDLLEFKNFGEKAAEEVCNSLKTRFNLELPWYD